MKRFLIFFLIAVLSAGLLYGCKSPEEPATEPVSEATTENHTTAAPETDAPTEATETETETPEETWLVPTGFPYDGIISEFLLFYNGTLYLGTGIRQSLPEEAEFVGKVASIDTENIPDEEFETSYLYVGMDIYSLNSGKMLFAKYDSTRLMLFEPYTGEPEDLKGRGIPEVPDLKPKLYAEVSPGQVFRITVLPQVDRDAVFEMERYVTQYQIGILYDTIAEKAFSVYVEKESLDTQSAYDWMYLLMGPDGVLSVERPQDVFPGQKLSNYRYGPEIIPVGGVTENDPVSGWSEYATMEEALKEAARAIDPFEDFSFEIPENDLEKVYRVGIGHYMTVMEVIFLENGEEVYRVRKGRGYGDPSGDTEHTVRYARIDDAPDALETFFKHDGDMNVLYTAYRSYHDWSYSVTSVKGLSEEEMLKLFTDDKHTHPEVQDFPNSREITDYLPENWENRT